MIEDQIDALLTAANPVTDEQVHPMGPRLDAAATDLREHVVATPHPLDPAAPDRAGGARWGRRLGIAAAAVVVFATAFVVVGSRGGGDGTAWAADEVAFAEASPLLLLDADGWKVTQADQQPGFGGDMAFASADEKLDLRWRTDDLTPALDSLKRNELELVAEVSTLGTTVFVLRDEGSDVHIAAWESAGARLELWGTTPDDDEFVGLVRSLRVVDADAWLSALPASTVKGIDRSRVVAEMLADMDVPSDFDPAALTADAQVRDRYQLGAQVAGAVACAWLDRWDGAQAAGDQQGMDEASAALAASRAWQVLAEMDAEGAYPEVLWEVADSMAAGHPSTGGGKGPGTGDAGAALGCEDR